MIVEHTSINPNKAAHVGHLRNATLGDTFVRILRYRGHEVVVQNYIDDTGVQVADVVVGFQHLEKQVTGRGRGADRRAAVRLLLLGPLRPRRRLLRRRSGAQGAAGRGAARHRGGRQRDRASWRADRRSDRRVPPRHHGSGWESATTCWPTRATSCGSTSGTGPSSCSRSSRRAAPRGRGQERGLLGPGDGG